MSERDPIPGGAVAVVGMAGRFPGAGSVEELWRNLCAGVESISRFSAEEAAAAGVPAERLADETWVRAGGVLDDPQRFDAALFGISPGEAARTDPQHRLFLETAWAALEDAGLPPRGIGADLRVGVYAGAGYPAYLLDHAAPALRHPGPADDFAASYSLVLGNDKDFLATRVAYRLDLRGPAVAVGSACSTSLVAVCTAASALAGGECDVAVAGGVTLRLPQRSGYPWQPDGILSPDGHCRAFDAEAAGTVPGSGVGAVVLRRLEDALADGDPVRAVIRGWAVNNDGGDKAGYTAPRAEGQEEVIREALALAGIEAASVGYVETHGTATPLGDPIELEALRRAFAGAPEGACALGSVKTNFGHLDAAAGVAGLIKTVLAVERGVIPPSLHFRTPNPRLGLEGSPFVVAAEGRDWDGGGSPRRAGVSSFGIGGTNAHVVLEQAPPEEERPPAAGPHLVLVSAATEGALERSAAALAERLEAPEGGGLDLGDVAHTLQVGRTPLAHRRAAVVHDGAGAWSGEVWSGAVSGDGAGGRHPVAFLFPGQGSQHPGMGGQLYAREPTFRAALDRCAELLRPHLAGQPGVDLAWALPPTRPAPGSEDEAARRLAHTALAQPALFAVCWSLAELWEGWGVVADAMLGHSLGELVAACRAGVFTLSDALALVAARGLLMADLPRGSMAAVPLPAEELAARLEDVSPRLAVAAVNAPALCVASGPAPEVGELTRRLEADGVVCRRLHTSHAFHSPLVEAAVEPFRRRVEQVVLKPPVRPFLSNVTGTWITPEEATDPAYWARHLAAPVRFAPAVETLLEEPGRLLLEVGPGRALTQLVARFPAAAGRCAVASLPHPRDDVPELDTLLAAAARLFVAGAVPARAGFGDRPLRRVSLPTYPFGGERHWLQRRPAGGEAEMAETAETAPPDAAGGGVVKKDDPADWFYLPAWRRLPPLHLDAAERPDGPDGPVLLVADAGGPGAPLAAGLAAALERRGEEVVRRAPAEVADGETPPRAVWLGAVAGPPEKASASVDEGVAAAAGLLAVARALSAAGGEVRLVAVSDALYRVGGEPCRRPGRAAAAGVARVLPQEMAGLACRWVDAGAAEELDERAMELLATEVASPATTPLVALRDGRRWGEVFEPVRLEEGAGGFAAGGAYLIAGGTGRFGVALARHLATERGARVVLLDRREPEGELARQLEELGAAGAEVVFEGGDAADPEVVRRAVARATGSGAALRGVVHAAGAPADQFRPVAELDRDALADHLSAKVAVAEALSRVVEEMAARSEDPRGERPFVLATSSLTPLLGGVGLGLYAAADAALGAVAAAAARRGGARWLSVDWEVWDQPFAGSVGETLGEQQTALALSADEVLLTCRRALALGGEGRAVVAAGDLAARVEQWTAASRPRRPAASGPRDSGVPYRAPAEPLEVRVAEIWGAVLGVDRVGLDDDFFLLGGDSLAGLQVLSKLRSELDVELPLEAFFEARTVAGMVEVVAAERRRGAEEEARMTEMLAEIEELDDERAAALLAEEES